MRTTAKGQMTIPAKIREKAGLPHNTNAELTSDGRHVRLIPATTRYPDSRGARLVANLRGSGHTAMSTDNIMALTRCD